MKMHDSLYTLQLKGIMHISSNPLAWKPVIMVIPMIAPENLRSIGPDTRRNSAMGGPIDLKFSGDILGNTGLLARGLLEMCMIPFKSRSTTSAQLDDPHNYAH